MFKRKIDWILLEKAPLVFAVFSLGALVGAVTSYELFDIKLTEGSGEMLGAALGAFLAVSLAWWLDQRRQRGERHAMKEAMYIVFAPLFEKVIEPANSSLVEYNEGNGSHDAVRAAFTNVFESLLGVRGQLATLLPVFSKNAVDLLVHTHLVGAVEVTGGEARWIAAQYTPIAHDWFPPAPGTHDGAALREAGNRLLKVVARVGQSHS